MEIRSLTVTTWNLGYAGLDATQDFKVDGGRRWRPRSRATVEANLAGIADTLRAHDADVFLLQEVARPSWVNHRVDVLAGVRAALPDHDVLPFADVSTRLIPPPFNIAVDLAIAVRADLPAIADSRPLPQEPRRALGLYRRRYPLTMIRIASPEAGRDWVVANLHLAAFDDEGRVRRAQLTALRDIARAEHEGGYHVILGGDWNMRLAPTEFPHRTHERYLGWVHDLPDDAFPDGWPVVTDPSTPTDRSLQQPYVAGENYTSIIDGFVVSPGVQIDGVETTDLQFRHSDHQPVTLRVRAP